MAWVGAQIVKVEDANHNPTRVARWVLGGLELGAGGLSYPSTGLLRLPNNGGGLRSITADAAHVVNLIDLDGSNVVQIGDGTQSASMNLKAGSGGFTALIGSTSLLAWTTSSLRFDIGTMAFLGTLASVLIQQNNAASGTGAGFTLHAQDVNSGGVGGDLILRAGHAAAEGSLRFKSNTTDRLVVDGTGIGVFGAAPVARQSVSGSRAGNAALASVLTALANLGWITDGSSA